MYNQSSVCVCEFIQILFKIKYFRLTGRDSWLLDVNVFHFMKQKLIL